MIDAELLEILCCPESRQDVRLADPQEIEKLNRAIHRGHLNNRAGRLVDEPLEGALVRTDGQWAYPIRHAIPVMLIEEALPLAHL
jgi:uncharacterized protein